jgi:selenocysteine lyase/cysteine desulfurase
MNNAATSWPKPPCVAEAVSGALAGRPGSAQRGGIEEFDVFGVVRRKMAKVLGVAVHDHIALGSNATWALNLGIFGYPFNEGDTVITSKAEHNSVLRPLYELERRGLVKVTYLDTDKAGRIPINAWEDAIRLHKPRLAVFTHASNVTGAVNDAEALSRAAKAAGADVLLDASQTCGWEDVEADGWDIDMVAFTGHKYLLGPQGTGGLYVRPGLTLHPHLVGGTGTSSDLDTMPDKMPIHLEAGTGNEPSFHGLLAALEWAERNPPDRTACGDALSALRQGLRDAGAELIVPDGACTPVVSFNIPGQPPEDVGYILAESYCLICRTGLHCAPKLFGCIGREGGTVRLSLSRFTAMDEIDAVVSAVKDIAGAV